MLVIKRLLIGARCANPREREKNVKIAATWIVLSLTAWHAWSQSTFQMGIHRDATSWWWRAELQYSGIAVDGVVLSGPGGSIPFVQESPESFGAESDRFNTLRGLWEHLGGDGNRFLSIFIGAGAAEYQMTWAEPHTDWFPSMPTFDPIEEPLSHRVRLSWTWEGDADAKLLEIHQRDEFHMSTGHGAGYLVWRGEPGFEDLEYTFDLLPVPGWLETRILYANLRPDLVPSWLFLEGKEDVVETRLFYTVSYDERYLQVVPEPMSAGLVAGGLIFARFTRDWRRRRYR